MAGLNGPIDIFKKGYSDAENYPESDHGASSVKGGGGRHYRDTLPYKAGQATERVGKSVGDAVNTVKQKIDGWNGKD